MKFYNIFHFSAQSIIQSYSFSFIFFPLTIMLNFAKKLIRNPPEVGSLTRMCGNKNVQKQSQFGCGSSHCDPGFTCLMKSNMFPDKKKKFILDLKISSFPMKLLEHGTFMPRYVRSTQGHCEPHLVLSEYQSFSALLNPIYTSTL